MSYIFFDVETTGLSKHSDILALAALETNDDFRITNIYNEYYLYYEEVPSGAAAVHGLTAQKLAFLADRDFATAAKDVHALFSGNKILSGHNVNNFDIPVLKNNLQVNGYDLQVGKTCDTLEMARTCLSGSHKLENCVRTLAAITGASDDYLEKLFQQTPELTEKVINKDMQYHSALYDAYCSYCICVLMKQLWD